MLSALIWIDVVILHMATFVRSKPGETISAATWDMHLHSKWQGRVFVPIIDLLFRPWGKDHCRKAWTWQSYLYESGTL